jgi:hypothetical protein
MNAGGDQFLAVGAAGVDAADDDGHAVAFRQTDEKFFLLDVGGAGPLGLLPRLKRRLRHADGEPGWFLFQCKDFLG